MQMHDGPKYSNFFNIFTKLIVKKERRDSKIFELIYFTILKNSYHTVLVNLLIRKIPNYILYFKIFFYLSSILEKFVKGLSFKGEGQGSIQNQKYLSSRTLK